MWTIDRVIGELNKLAAIDGIGHIDVPVAINARLTRTLGRVKYITIGDMYLAQGIEFSKDLLDNGTDNDIINVIKHEYVHYYLVETTHTNHGHDAVFKKKCAEIGCTHDKTRNSLESDYAEQKQYKYEVWCGDCAKRIGAYSRMCKTLKNIRYCKCGNCNGSNLTIKQNW